MDLHYLSVPMPVILYDLEHFNKSFLDYVQQLTPTGCRELLLYLVIIEKFIDFVNHADDPFFDTASDCIENLLAPLFCALLNRLEVKIVPLDIQHVASSFVFENCF